MARGSQVPRGHNWIMAHIDYAGDDCLPWPFAVATKGYAQFQFEGVLYAAHRYVCRLKRGEPPAPNSEAAHSCGNMICMNWNHLSWKSPSGNQRDRRKHGTMNTKHSKLTAENVAEIRRTKDVETCIQAGERFGVTAANIYAIRAGKTWRQDRKKRAPLTDEQVREIRRIGRSRPAEQVAKAFGVSRTAVSSVRLGRSYKAVP